MTVLLARFYFSNLHTIFFGLVLQYLSKPFSIFFIYLYKLKKNHETHMAINILFTKKLNWLKNVILCNILYVNDEVLAKIIFSFISLIFNSTNYKVY